jgi:cytochrome P450
MSTQTPSAVAWPAWEDPAFYVQDRDVMHASMAAQRREAPVYWYEPPGFPRGFWVLSKWEHQRFVGSNPELFSNRFGFAVGDASDPSVALPQLPAWAQEELARPGLTHAQTRGLIAQGKLSLGDRELKNMMLMDPPRHGEVRSIFMKALRPSLVRGQRARVSELADEFLDEIPPGVETDFVTTVGRIPAALMTELIGVPREMRERFIELAGAHLQAIVITPGKDPEEVRRIEALGAEFRAYIADLLDERRQGDSSANDLVSIIARSELDGEPLSNGVATVYVTHFISAGETTRALLSHLALALAEDPAQRRLLAEQPDLIPNAIEETLRFYPNNWSGCRTALADVEIGGKLIKQDDYVMMAYPSGNRDEDVWERPDAFDITRPFDHDHIAFGHGEHSCPGALLTRVASRGIVERLLARYPDWELAGAPQRWSNPFLQGMTSLPLTFSA